MTGRSRVPKSAAAGLGVRAHSGWAAYVVLAGTAEAPEIVLRGRMELCDPTTKGSKQPFHEAEPMAYADAEHFIGSCRASTARFADRALAEVEAVAGRLSACHVLTASGRKLPDLAGILASHALIHAAEGEFYRDAIVEACTRKGIRTDRIRERDLAAAVEYLPGDVAVRRARLDAFGKKVGSPWRQDEKLSALAAWLALVSSPTGRAAGRVPP